MSWVSPPAVAVVVVDIIFTTLAFITVCFRLFTRGVLVKNVGSDDYYIAGSMVSLAFLPLFGGHSGWMVWELTGRAELEKKRNTNGPGRAYGLLHVMIVVNKVHGRAQRAMTGMKLFPWCLLGVDHFWMEVWKLLQGTWANIYPFWLTGSIDCISYCCDDT